MSDTSTNRRELRNACLSNGYPAIPLADKGVYIKGWSRVEITEEWLEQFARSARYPNTGIRCDNLLAFDIDVLDEDLADMCEAEIERMCGETPLCRVGRWPKRLLVYKLDGEPDKSGRTGKYGGHMVELLANNGRQFAAFGIHPGTRRPYEWEAESPLDLSIDRLPGLSAERALECLDRLDFLLDETGLERERRAHLRGNHGQFEYDLTDDLLVEYEGERMSWGALKGELTQEGGFGNLYRKEYDDFGDSSAVHFYIARGSLQPCAHDFVNDTTHFESTYTPELAELLPAVEQDKQETPLTPLLENWVIIADGTVRHIEEPTRRFKLADFKNRHKHLQILVPRAKGPDKIVQACDVWLEHRDTMRADYAALRPDYPDDWLIREEKKKLSVFNTYAPPDHSATGGEIETAIEFVEHLVPNDIDREIFWDWNALKVANPGMRLHVLLMVTPQFGTGRGTWVQILSRLMGQQYVNDVPLHDLIGRDGQAQYNDHMADSLIISVPEALEETEQVKKWEARHLAYEQMKLIAETYPTRMLIKRKYGGKSMEWVFASILVSSNHRNALAIPPGDRRIIVIENTMNRLTEAPGDLIERIHDWKNNPANIAALHQHLCARAAFGVQYDPMGMPPETAAKRAMIEAGQSGLDQVFDILVDTAEGDMITHHQFHRFAVEVSKSHGIELPDYTRIDAGIKAILSTHCVRPDTLPKSNQVRIGKSRVRPWIFRNIDRWKCHAIDSEFKAEIEKNGDPGAAILPMPS